MSLHPGTYVDQAIAGYGVFFVSHADTIVLYFDVDFLLCLSNVNHHPGSLSMFLNIMQTFLYTQQNILSQIII